MWTWVGSEHTGVLVSEQPAGARLCLARGLPLSPRTVDGMNLPRSPGAPGENPGGRLPGAMQSGPLMFRVHPMEQLR